MNKTINWQSITGVIAMLLPLILTFTGYDAAPIWNQINIGVGAALVLWGRFKDQPFSITSSTLISCILAFASTFLTTNGINVETQVTPEANVLFQSVMAIAALLGVKLNLTGTPTNTVK